MKLTERFKRLNTWNKLQAIGALASIVGLAVWLWPKQDGSMAVITAPEGTAVGNVEGDLIVNASASGGPEREARGDGEDQSGALRRDTSSDEETTKAILGSAGQGFASGNPYPLGFDRVPIGTSLSVLKKVYPSATFSPAWSTWSVDLDEGLFRSVRFSATDSDNRDPEVTWIEFFFRDEIAKDQVWSHALSAFGADVARVKNLGEQLEWPNIDGVRASIDPVRYSISRSDR